jgi:hypothetical protein
MCSAYFEAIAPNVLVLECPYVVRGALMPLGVCAEADRDLSSWTGS